MPDVNGPTLMMAIQAVDKEIRALQDRIANTGSDDDISDDEEALFAYRDAARQLRDAYEIARLTSSNLLPYAQLIRKVQV